MYHLTRDKEVRLFLCGDYAFLCAMYGLSGASGGYSVKLHLHVYTPAYKTSYCIGKHNCLWCEISSDQLKTPRCEREPSQKRSLQSLQRDYEGFVRGGGDIRSAKDYHNVIQPYFFEIPLNQVSLKLHNYSYNHAEASQSVCNFLLCIVYTCMYILMQLHSDNYNYSAFR